MYSAVRSDDIDHSLICGVTGMLLCRLLRHACLSVLGEYSLAWRRFEKILQVRLKKKKSVVFFSVFFLRANTKQRNGKQTCTRSILFVLRLLRFDLDERRVQRQRASQLDHGSPLGNFNLRLVPKFCCILFFFSASFPIESERRGFARRSASRVNVLLLVLIDGPGNNGTDISLSRRSVLRMQRDGNYMLTRVSRI